MSTSELRPGLLAPWILVLGLTLAASLFVVLFGFRAQGFVNTTLDPYHFGMMGESIARGGGFIPFGNLIEHRAPLYPLVIGGVN